MGRMMTTDILVQIVLGTTVAVSLGAIVGLISRRRIPPLRPVVWRAAVAAFWLVPAASVAWSLLPTHRVTVPVRVLPAPAEIGRAHV